MLSSPAVEEVSTRTAPVDALVRVSVAFGIAAPVASVIVPTTRPESDWAEAKCAANTYRAGQKKRPGGPVQHL